MARSRPLQLVLLRHGIAVNRGDPAFPNDPERPLTERGRARTTRVLRVLAKFSEKPGVILSSPYRRALETAEIAAEQFGIPLKSIERTERLVPLAEPATILRQIAGLDAEVVLLVGHAPHLDRLVAQCLLGTGDSVTALKKSGAACLRLERLRPARSRLEWLVTPKLLRQVREG